MDHMPLKMLITFNKQHCSQQKRFLQLHYLDKLVFLIWIILKNGEVFQNTNCRDS